MRTDSRVHHPRRRLSAPRPSVGSAPAQRKAVVGCEPAIPRGGNITHGAVSPINALPSGGISKKQEWHTGREPDYRYHSFLATHWRARSAPACGWAPRLEECTSWPAVLKVSAIRRWNFQRQRETLGMERRLRGWASGLVLLCFLGVREPRGVEAATSGAQKGLKDDFADMIDGAERLQFGTYFRTNPLTRTSKRNLQS